MTTSNRLCIEPFLALVSTSDLPLHLASGLFHGLRIISSWRFLDIMVLQLFQGSGQTHLENSITSDVDSLQKGRLVPWWAVSTCRHVWHMHPLFNKYTRWRCAMPLGLLDGIIHLFPSRKKILAPARPELLSAGTSLGRAKRLVTEMPGESCSLPAPTSF